LGFTQKYFTCVGIRDQIKPGEIAESNPLGTNSFLSVTLLCTFSKLLFVHSDKLNNWRNYLSQKLRTSHSPTRIRHFHV